MNRLTRSKYLLRFFLFLIGFFVLLFILGLLKPSNPLFLTIISILFIINIGYFFKQTSYRLRDLNLPWTWTVILFAPILNIFFLLYLLFKRGTKGKNDYGEDPLA
jgi:uncharacterized membrane protein YhaH (DUF805 family)